MTRYTFTEITPDRGCALYAVASNNSATYILTSGRAIDMYADYCDKYNRVPSSRWFHKHFNFTTRRHED